MIDQCSRTANDAGWLKYSGWAERHFLNPGMSEAEKLAMKQGLALGYDAAKSGEWD